MAKKLKKRKSSILKNMNPDFVNKLSCIMGGVAKVQESKNEKKNKKSIGGRSNANGKETASKPKYPPLPPPLPAPIAKPTKKIKPETVETDIKPVIQEITTIPEKKHKQIEVYHPNTSVPIPINSGTRVENNTNINENYFDTMRDIVSLSYENNRYFLENGLKYIVDHREITKPLPQGELNKLSMSFNDMKCMAIGFFIGVLFSYVM